MYNIVPKYVDYYIGVPAGSNNGHEVNVVITRRTTAISKSSPFDSFNATVRPPLCLLNRYKVRRTCLLSFRTTSGRMQVTQCFRPSPIRSTVPTTAQYSFKAGSSNLSRLHQTLKFGLKNLMLP